MNAMRLLAAIAALTAAYAVAGLAFLVMAPLALAQGEARNHS